MENDRRQLGQIDPRRARFPCCIVWTPIPFITWLVPFIGHIGICREDGVILDFSGPHFVSVDNFAFGAVARYIQVNCDECYKLIEPEGDATCAFHRGFKGGIFLRNSMLHDHVLNSGTDFYLPICHVRTP
ncbi:hypothetical protein ACJX0J_010514, partial [Zea mays]